MVLNLVLMYGFQMNILVTRAFDHKNCLCCPWREIVIKCLRIYDLFMPNLDENPARRSGFAGLVIV